VTINQTEIRGFSSPSFLFFMSSISHFSLACILNT
jgi:hypothetical protein